MAVRIPLRRLSRSAASLPGPHARGAAAAPRGLSSNTSAAAASSSPLEHGVVLEETADPRPRGTYFAPLDIVDGVAIIRLDGPGKMNTISDGVM